jgi:hypothetical protein
LGGLSRDQPFHVYRDDQAAPPTLYDAMPARTQCVVVLRRHN